MLFSGAAVVGSGFSAILIFKVKPRPTDGRVRYQLLPLTDLQKNMAVAGNFSCVPLANLSDKSCPDNINFCSEFKNVPAVYLSISIVSFFCCCLVFLTYILIKRLWGYSSRVFLLRYVLDLYYIHISFFSLSSSELLLIF